MLEAIRITLTVKLHFLFECRREKWVVSEVGFNHDGILKLGSP
jgi:hypothetical protein